MTHDEILQMVTDIMREYFDNDTIVLNQDTTAEDVPEWDSFNHVNILIAIEQRLKIKFLTSEVEGLHNVGELVALIQKKGPKG
jgi:acyl carrier protein